MIFQEVIFLSLFLISLSIYTHIPYRLVVCIKKLSIFQNDLRSQNFH